MKFGEKLQELPTALGSLAVRGEGVLTSRSGDEDELQVRVKIVQGVGSARFQGGRIEILSRFDRAKGQLMDRHRLAEADAFGFIQKTAMRQRSTMKQVAESVIEGELTPET